MAIGNGSKLPLVMSTSIKEKAGLVKKNNIRKYTNFFSSILLAFLLGQSLVAFLSIFHNL